MAQATRPRSTISSPALQNQPESSKRGSSNARENRRHLPRAGRRAVGERLDRDLAELGVDRVGSAGLVESRNCRDARRDVGVADLGLAAGAIELDHRRGAGRAEIAERENILAAAAIGVAPDRVAALVEFRHRQRKRRKRLVDLDPFGVGGLGGEAAARHHFGHDQPHRGERAAIGGEAQQHGVEFAREHAQHRVGDAQAERTRIAAPGQRGANAQRGKPPADRLRGLDHAMPEKLHPRPSRTHL